MATSAGWAETLTAIFDDTDCKEPDPEIGEQAAATYLGNNLYSFACNEFAGGANFVFLQNVLIF